MIVKTTSAEGGLTDVPIPAMQIVQSPHLTRRLAIWLSLAFFVLPFILGLVPWMQTLSGKGRVVAETPIERQMKITAPYDGFVVDYHGHYENSYVRRGDKLFKMTAADALLADRVEIQLLSYRQKIESNRQKVSFYQELIGSYEFSRSQALFASDAMIESAKNKVESAQANLRGAQGVYNNQKAIRDRTKRLVENKLGLEAQQKLDEEESKYQKAKADLDKAEADLSSAQNEVKAKQAEREQKKNDADAKVSEAKAKHQEAVGELAIANKEQTEIETKKAEIGRYEVTAPMDGRILRIERALETDLVKKGETVLVLVPETGDPAVELWVSGNDAPLIAGAKDSADQAGESLKVAIQFEGYPAVQFAGWPSIARGTFPGVVKLIDSHDDGEGKFRILVVPDPDTKVSWPERSFLPQGIQANGWVMLRQVPLGWEIWRRLNGFPPAIKKDTDDKASGSDTDKKSGGVYKKKKK